MKSFIFIIALAAISCSPFKAPPRALIVTPTLDRVSSQLNSTKTATSKTVESARKAAIAHPTSPEVRKVVDDAIEADEAMQATQAAFDNLGKRIRLMEQQAQEISDDLFIAKQNEAKLKTRIANWRLTAVSAIGAFLFSTTLLIKPWRYFAGIPI